MKKRTMAKLVLLTPEVLRNRTLASKIVNEVADVLAEGNVVILPTETAYGIAADATNEAAVKKVFEIKQRPLDRSIPIMVSDRYMIDEYAKLTDLAKHLMHDFMPGPLSLVVPMKEGSKLAPSLSGKGVAFRIPGNDFARAIVSELDKPITTTSANISGEGPLYAADEVKSRFMEKVEMILDQGTLNPVDPSTVLDLQHGEPKILRQGPVTEQEILQSIAEFKEKSVVVPA